MTPDTSAISAVSLGARGRLPRWQLDAHAVPDEHRLFWITRGGGRVRVDGVTRGFGPHVAIFLPANTVHALETTPAVTGWILSVAADAKHGMDWPFPSAPTQAVITDARAQQTLTAICETVSQEDAGSEPGRETALLCQAGLLSVWLARNLAISGAAGTRSTDLMRAFTRKIETEIGQGVTVSSCAAALGITTTHLSRICREIAGCSAGQIIHERMLLEAKRRLASETTSISELSEALGFSSPAYFSRVFAAKTGLSPRNFRRQEQSQMRH